MEKNKNKWKIYNILMTIFAVVLIATVITFSILPAKSNTVELKADGSDSGFYFPEYNFNLLVDPIYNEYNRYDNPGILYYAGGEENIQYTGNNPDMPMPIDYTLMNSFYDRYSLTPQFVLLVMAQILGTEMSTNYAILAYGVGYDPAMDEYQDTKEFLGVVAFLPNCNPESIGATVPQGYTAGRINYDCGVLQSNSNVTDPNNYNFGIMWGQPQIVSFLTDETIAIQARHSYLYINQTNIYQIYQDGFDDGYDIGYNEGLEDGAASVPPSQDTGIGESFFSAAVNLVNALWTGAVEFFSVPIVGDMNIGTLTIGIPAVFMILSGVIGLVKSLLGHKKE